MMQSLIERRVGGSVSLQIAIKLTTTCQCLAYISNRRLLLSLADAGGRLMFAYKDLLELAGLTPRLYILLSTLHTLEPLPSHYGDVDGAIELSHVDVGIPPIHGANGEVISADSEFESDVEDYERTPPLVRDLSLMVKEGEHLMITGSNGVGKTAVARVLAGLWAPQGPDADVKRPAIGKRKNIVVVPQRAYMVTGSLLDQIIYPHSYPEFVESGKTLADLTEILEMVHLAYLPEREGGWSTRKEWRDVLSGGEKQRVRDLLLLYIGSLSHCFGQMGMARVFYHKPRFAVLDGK